MTGWRSRPRTVIAALGSLAVVFSSLLAQPPVSPGVDDEQSLLKTLKDAGLPTDGPGLVEYFRSRTPTKDDAVLLPQLVRQLGDEVFARREHASRALLAIGERALPVLRAAVNDPDIETARRARHCVDIIEAASKGRFALPAARLLALRKSEGALETLLDYLPSSGDEASVEAMFEAMAPLAGKGKARIAGSVLAAAADPAPERRAFLCHVLGEVAGYDDVLAARAADAHPWVRFHAARALWRRKDARSVTTLIALLEGDRPELIWRVEEILARLPADKDTGIRSADLSDAAARKKYRADWEKWWHANEKTVDLATIPLDNSPLNLLVTCEIDGLGNFPGRVKAFDRAGNTRWEVDKLNSPTDVQLLPGGRLLVAHHWDKNVTLRDRSGKILWEHKVGDFPVSCERLPGGNTFIATYRDILEVTPEGKTVSSFKSRDGSMIYCARRLPGGNILYGTSAGRVVELNAKGEEVHQFTPRQYAEGATHWMSVDVLSRAPAKDRYLIALSGSHRVIETDRDGKILWEAAAQNAVWAQRLPSGNTLVANVEDNLVLEIDRQGKEVWRQKVKGRPFRVRQY